MTTYLTEYNWDDVVPVPQDDGGPDALVVIAYNDDYRTAMGYLRAIMRVEEYSERAFQLTSDIIFMNAAHYTVWTYRTRILFALGKDCEQELEWLEYVASKFPKNYQIWNHREIIVEKYNSPIRELPFIEAMLALDSKNYHVWSYRQWVVRRFNLWATELAYTSNMIEDDVRNNSAWNHRYFALFGAGAPVNDGIVASEIEFTKDAILKAPQNASAWNYLSGLVRTSKRPLSSLEDFCTSLASFPMTVSADSQEIVQSARALEVLADIYAEKRDLDRALQAWTLLADKYDTIRVNFWNYKKLQATRTIMA
ncbi:uncharacterized protein V1518DRAFT_410556 [Limtongia smithiae]|uniref:uncharacterized protein n=1 Tax=Limtongia smithiae TaxID=1125753 RepID=UPI0034CD2DA8